MARDVFISYSSRDKTVADAACATLEAEGIRCWIAPRDILPGTAYGEAIINAIHASRVMVLIFSDSANRSPQVMREVERAVSRGIPILPFRIENVPLSPNMEYFISAPHWLDAMSKPLEDHLHDLAAAVKSLLPHDRDTTTVDRQPDRPTRAEPPTVSIASSRPPRRNIAIGLAVLTPILLAAVLLSVNAARRPQAKTRASAEPAVPGPSAPVGTMPAENSPREETPTAPAPPPAGDTDKPADVLRGKLGDVLTDGKWRFQVTGAKPVASYTMSFNCTNDYAVYHTTAEYTDPVFRPLAGHTLLALRCRVENASAEKQALWRPNSDTRTAVLDQTGESYPPIAYDIQEAGPFQSKDLLPDTGTDFTVLFTLPPGRNAGELIFTLRTISEPGSDVRVSLAPKWQGGLRLPHAGKIREPQLKR